MVWDIYIYIYIYIDTLVSSLFRKTVEPR